jgi:hypothetical protein
MPGKHDGPPLRVPITHLRRQSRSRTLCKSGDWSYICSEIGGRLQI